MRKLIKGIMNIIKLIWLIKKEYYNENKNKLHIKLHYLQN